VHYLCDEQADWAPDMDDIRRKITAHTRAIVLINPNNPTGAVYPPEVVRELLAIAKAHDLVVFSDEIYDKILYDDVTHTATGALADDDQLVITLNGLSKSYRCAGFRSGWMTLSGTRAKQRAGDFIQGLTMLASMRLCANVPAQHAIQTALGGYQSINDLVLPGGRLLAQRDITHEKLNAIPGVSCVKPKGALYAFPRLDPKVFNIKNDQQLVQDLLLQEKILLVQGTAFNWPEPDHVRIVTLPWADQLGDALDRFANFLSRYRQ
jgi:alanine-synthesizing transaminase